jgi:spermidine synthase
LTASLNLLACLIMFLLWRRSSAGTEATAAVQAPAPVASAVPTAAAVAVVFVTGFATFQLEVAWFRSFRAALQATTESFALVLCATLIGLAVGSNLAARLRWRWPDQLGTVLFLAGIAVLVVSPVVERFDLIVPRGGSTYGQFIVLRFGAALATLGPPMALLGIALPWLLDEAEHPRSAGILYAVNTFGAILGSLLAGWVFLPTIGSVRLSWLVGGLILLSSILPKGRRPTWSMAATAVAILVLVVQLDSGAGRVRAQGSKQALRTAELVDVEEGPDSTVSVIEEPSGARALIIDGFYAAGTTQSAHYMAWMGHLPMILHPAPQDALVICFGTGQTTNAVRLEGPRHVDVVDVNAAVFTMARHFAQNERVLEDARVRRIVMDGRAWLRRTDQFYDVVTLEPMPPTFAGSNALYSIEFYELIRERIRPNAVVAQWVPFHLLEPEQTAAVVRTFQEVFENTLLWFDPISTTGILVGTAEPTESGEIGQTWPGLERADVRRSLTAEAVQSAIMFGPAYLARFAEYGQRITDDNQYLSYGYGRLRTWGLGRERTAALRIVDVIREVNRADEAPGAPGAEVPQTEP